MMNTRRIAGLVPAFAVALAMGLGLFLAPSEAPAAPIPGGQIYSLGEPTNVDFLGSEAAYRSYLYLYDADDLDNPITGALFNSDAGVQPSVELLIPAGEEFAFAIHVDENIDGVIDHVYFMGSADRNGDNFLHAQVEELAPNLYRVGFEDLWGGGDKDFNDHVFLVGLLAPAQAVTGPAPLLLLGAGLLAGRFARSRIPRRRSVTVAPSTRRIDRSLSVRLPT